jgi:hypothetical protein
MQILGITGNNVLNNNTIIQYLGDALNKFPSTANQTRCFVHTVNLIAKSILKPFDIQKTKDLGEFTNVVQALADLGNDMMGDGHDPEKDTAYT